jgi:hypothetical protein
LKNGCLVVHYGYLEEKKGNFVLKQKEHKKYSLKEYGQTMLIPTILISPLTKRP